MISDSLMTIQLYDYVILVTGTANSDRDSDSNTDVDSDPMTEIRMEWELVRK